MPNEENLIRNSELTPDERKARASKAGKASGAARRKRKRLSDSLKLLLSLPTNSKEAQKAIEGMGLDADANNQDAIIAGLAKKAMKGDPKAVHEIRSILGELETTGQKAERKARTEKLTAETEVLRAKTNTEQEHVEDDGFMDALRGSASEDWNG